MTRRIDELLREYGDSHQHPVNKTVHWICVPLIAWSVIALVALVPAPAQLGWSGWVGPAAVAVLVYYLTLSPLLAAGMLIYLGICLLLIYAIHWAGLPIGWIALAVFVLAWIGQFWGHKVEGNRPSFFKDLQFLLIGPAWLIGALYRRAGISY